MEDIDLTDVSWEPINEFYGVLNGNGHSISGWELTLIRDNTDTNKYGLFATLYGSVRDLRLENIKLTLDKYDDTAEAIYVGALCAEMRDARITNVTLNDVDIWALHYRNEKKEYVNTYVGGLVGFVWGGEITNSVVSNTGIHIKAGTATGYGDAEAYAGGIVGVLLHGKLTNTETRDNVFLEGVARGNSSTTALRVAIGGQVGFQHKGTKIVAIRPSGAPSLRADFDVEDDWVYHSSSFAETGVISGKTHGDIIVKQRGVD